MLRFIALTIIAYFIFKFLDQMFGGRRRPAQSKQRASNFGQEPKKSKFNKDVGEYVDYEEVDTKDE